MRGLAKPQGCIIWQTPPVTTPCPWARSEVVFDDEPSPMAELCAAKRAKVVTNVSPESAGSEKGSSTPPSTRERPEGESAAGFPVAEDTDALDDCGVCFLSLKPPIFQCKVGHVVCSPCRDMLKDSGKCYVCGIATSYTRRCHAMERLLETIRVPCPNASYGCTARPAYYDKHVHSQTCLHTPCRCPGDSCRFVGSMEALIGHFASVHGWPCGARIKAGNSQILDIVLHLHDGFNFLLAVDCQGATSTASSSQHLFLLHVTRQPLGRVVSVHCIYPEIIPAGKEVKCSIRYSRFFYGPQNPFKYLSCQSVSMEVNLERTDLSNGLHNPDVHCQLVIPNSFLEDDQETVNVGAHVTIYNRNLN